MTRATTVHDKSFGPVQVDGVAIAKAFVLHMQSMEQPGSDGRF